MRPALARGDVLELRIDKAVYRGLGLARHQGCVVFVPRTYAGERVRARVEEVGRGYARAELEALLEPAPARRPAPCRFAERCGGCAYQDLEYAEQLAVKQAILRESLSRARVAWEGPLPVRPSPETGWRTRAELHLDWSVAEPRLGLHEQGSQRVVDVLECLQLSPSMNRAARALLAALAGRRPLAERVRGVELAEAADGSRLVACLDTDLDLRSAAGLSDVAAAVPGLGGLLVRPAPPARVVTLHGDPFVHAEVLGLRLRAHQQSFFQANRFLLEPLVLAVLDGLPAAGPVLDLYAGVGLFALPLAARGARVLGAETNPQAVQDARANAEAAGLPGLSFVAEDVELALRRAERNQGEGVVVDPPRTGLSRLAARALAARGPDRIVYVSCDPPTLGRDLRLLLDAGYRLTGLEAFDMFPDTFHLESVARLERA